MPADIADAIDPAGELRERPDAPYEPGELAQPGTYGPETFDRG